MNRKAQSMGQMSLIIGVFVTVIVGLVLFQGSGQYIGQTTLASSYSNFTYTLPAAGSSNFVEGIEAWGDDVVITNATGGETIPSTNYTITDRQLQNGALGSTIAVDDDSAYGSASANISGTWYPNTYDENSGNRAVIALVAVFFAIAIFVVALVAVKESNVFS